MSYANLACWSCLTVHFLLNTVYLKTSILHNYGSVWLMCFLGSFWILQLAEKSPLMLNGAWQWPQPHSDVECHPMGETERVMVLMLWGIKCRQINGTDFLHTSGNTIFFRSANMKTLSSLPLKNMCLSVRNKLLIYLFFSFSDPTFSPWVGDLLLLFGGGAEGGKWGQFANDVT